MVTGHFRGLYIRNIDRAEVIERILGAWEICQSWYRRGLRQGWETATIRRHARLIYKKVRSMHKQ